MVHYAEGLLDTYRDRAMAEANAGVTADTPGTAFAVWNSALQHAKQTASEWHAIRAHLGGW